MRRWLVVDDDPSVRDLFLALEEVMPVELLVVDSGFEALAAIREYDDVEVLLTDVMMPGMDGFELARQARRKAPHLHIYAMSGAMPEDEACNLFDHVLHKPFSVDRIQALAEQTLQSAAN